MNRGIRLVTAGGVGAGLMYLFDPDRGRRRRALILNKAKHASRITSNLAGKTRRDVSNHLHGVIAEVQSLFRSRDVADDVLEARVRSKLGRMVSHPSAVEVKAVAGVVILNGQILADEVHPLLNAIAAVHGVKNIENHLEVHESAGAIPSLQGGRQRESEHIGPLKSNWSPATRLMATAAGGALAIYGAKRRGLLGSAMSCLGLGVATRALTNIEAQRLMGIDSNLNGFKIEKTINIDTPIDRVFDYWSHPENFPSFMSHVREVKCIGERLYQWTIGDPTGLTAHWYAAITDLKANRLLAWESLPGSIIGQRGTVRFSTNPDGNTRVAVQIRYMSPVGASGHAIAKLFGVDSKHEMDHDLIRMKSIMERGVPPHHSAGHVATIEADTVV